MNSSPLKIVLMIALMVLATEMFLITVLHPTDFSENYWIFMDSLLLMLILSPILYFFVYRPMKVQVEIQEELVADRDHLVAELRKSLEVAGSLKDTMLICSSCSHIRNKEGQWQEMKLEQVNLTQTSFRKGMCLSCMERKYPEQYNLLISKKVVQSG